MQITFATHQDENAIKALLQACELPYEDIGSEHLAHFFVIKDAGQVEAVIGMEQRTTFGLLRSLAVAESSRGQGLGLQLVSHLEDYARSQQIEALYLLTTTADKLFARLGYQPIPRANAPEPLQATAEFQSICPASAVCMMKLLYSG